MRTRQLVLRSLTYYWRTNIAVVLGVATSVAVLAGALLVGDSVRGSLRDLVLDRLGRTDMVVAGTGLFREQLAGELAAQPAFSQQFSRVTPLVIAQGMVAVQDDGRRAGQVSVYAVDDRFWRFHGIDGMSGPANRDAYLSPALARRLGATAGSAILVRVQRPTDVPLESLHGRRDNLGRSLRLTVANVLSPESLGEFSLEAQQGEVAAVFVPLARLQDELDIRGRVNTLLVSSGLSPPHGTASDLQALVRSHASLDDIGLTVEALTSPAVVAVSSSAGLLDDAHAAAATQALDASRTSGHPLFTYLANSIRHGDREVPYSLVTAIDLSTLPVQGGASQGGDDGATAGPIVLNDWTATELGVRAGDTVTMDYYLWEDPGRLVTKTAAFRVSAIVPIAAGDRNMAPSYPGISDSPTLEDWDPPFPVDLRKVRRVDELYWEQYRTTPKAFVPLDVGQRLWRTRYGSMTSIRFAPAGGDDITAARTQYAERLRAAVDPLVLGLAVVDVRAQGLGASRGATDFGEYFVYFSFFIVVSALLLAALFFKLGIEQRVREVGLLRAVGYGPRQVRWLFLREGALLAVLGSVLGVIGAVGYAAAIMAGLRSWWVDAVGTTSLTLYVTPTSLAAGAVGGVLASVACVAWTLRALGGISERSLLMGQVTADGMSATGRAKRHWKAPVAAVVFAVLAVAMLAAGVTGSIDRAGAFFGAGFALLTATLCAVLLVLRRRGATIEGHGWLPVSRLGMRSATYRPGRSVLSVAVIASATFILISVDAFRRDERLADTGPQSGVGGYSLIVESLLPIVRDPNTEEGRDALNLFGLDASVTFEPFRLLPGDDASCRNLYEPRNPRIAAPSEAFLREGRFSFASSLAATEAERANPWLLLTRVEADGAIPVIADANSMTYVLHKQLGDDIVIPHGGGEVRLRLVAALADSIFQSELLMAPDSFLRLFPEQEGYRLLLVQTAAGSEAPVKMALEEGLGDFGVTVTGTVEHLARFHQVENTYLSTFQTLGGLGLLLGTLGLATVLLRNVLERRRELALLGAVGYRRAHVLLMVMAENAVLLGAGLAAGAISAGVAIAPAIAERGGRFPLTTSGLLLLFAVFITGLLSSGVAMNAATRTPLLASLRSE